MPDLDAVLDRHIAAFNAKDIAAFMADYAPDAVVHLFGSRVLQGAEAIRAHFARAFALDPTLRLEVVDRSYNGSRIEIAWVSKRGRRIVARGTEEYLFDGEARIRSQWAFRSGRS